MIVLIRADATPASGTGHVMRCAALGIRLNRDNVRLHFASASMPPPLADWLRARGFVVHRLPGVLPGDQAADLVQSLSVAQGLGGVDLMVVDHYGLGLVWERGMRKSVRRILAIDDLANRDHDCDVLLDQNLHREAEQRYAGRVPRGTLQFIGPRFALLRPEFDNPSLARERDGSVNSLLVFFGGTDPGNQTLKVIDALRQLGAMAPPATLVLGPAHPNRAKVHSAAEGLDNVIVIDATNEMANLIRSADLAIGTCGVSAWERCLLALPSIVVVTAENQREDAEILHELEAVICLGDAMNVTSDDWAQALAGAIGNPARLQKMGAAAFNVMSGRHDGFAELERALVV
jgi:UDP-2,4-diacetamido-2,4,6-trideoxy-beta-L-altropyranose hydrolase